MGTHGREDNLQSVGHKDHTTQFSTTHKPQPLENPLGVESAPSSLDTNWTLWVSLRSKLLQGCFIGLQEKEQVMFCLWCGFHWPWSGCSFDHHNFRAYPMKQQRAAGESHTQVTVLSSQIRIFLIIFFKDYCYCHLKTFFSKFPCAFEVQLAKFIHK